MTKKSFLQAWNGWKKFWNLEMAKKVFYKLEMPEKKFEMAEMANKFFTQIGQKKVTVILGSKIT